MREILFRGKRIDNGEWIEGLPYKAKYGGISAIVNENEERFVIIPESISQFIGLTDKKGKRIFEGDIVNHYVNWLGKRVNGVVKYEVKVASWVCDFSDNKESAFLADWVDGNGCEAIGNIHDNPELLEVKND